jgi:hypothetical protein
MRQESVEPPTTAAATAAAPIVAAHASGTGIVLFASAVAVATFFVGWLVALAPLMGTTGDRSDYLFASGLHVVAGLLVGGIGLAIRGSVPSWASSTTLLIAGFLLCLALGFVGGGA